MSPCSEVTSLLPSPHLTASLPPPPRIAAQVTVSVMGVEPPSPFVVSQAALRGRVETMRGAPIPRAVVRLTPADGAAGDVCCAQLCVCVCVYLCVSVCLCVCVCVSLSFYLSLPTPPHPPSLSVGTAHTRLVLSCLLLFPGSAATVVTSDTDGSFFASALDPRITYRASAQLKGFVFDTTEVCTASMRLRHWDAPPHPPPCHLSQP